MPYDGGRSILAGYTCSHRRDGSALRSGGFFSLVVDRGFRDARGAEPAADGRRRYSVVGDERRPLDPARWGLGVPRAGSREPFTVHFDRPLDHGLLAHSLRVAASDGPPVNGTWAIGNNEEYWELTPTRPWRGTPHLLWVDSELEDIAGNSVARVFDRDLSRPEDRPPPDGPVPLPFRPA